MNECSEIGRLALRPEGDRWIAYYALSDTMNEPQFLGAIHMGAIVDNPRRKEAFVEIMRDIVSDIIEEKTGQRPIWGDPRRAPEHERSGHG